MEYEYSYRVKDLAPYLKEIEKNFKFIEKVSEKRTIYRTDESIARITYRNDEMLLDFKENKVMVNGSIERKETRAIRFDNLENCEEILRFLNYTKDATVVRNRSVYEGNNIKFEIDEYFEPEKANVVSFEGDKETCDKYNIDFLKLFNSLEKSK